MPSPVEMNPRAYCTELGGGGRGGGCGEVELHPWGLDVSGAFLFAFNFFQA